MSLPTLKTNRLVLRPFEQGDASTVQRLAGVPEVALTTQNIPHPYEDGLAEVWIASHVVGWDAGEFLTLAITESTQGLVGAVGLHINARHRRGELGYWIGLPYWKRGFATEASARLIQFGFDEMNLNRIQARHLTRNPASGRVMQKLGMTFEGTHREHIIARGKPEDIAMYAILKSDRR